MRLLNPLHDTKYRGFTTCAVPLTGLLGPCTDVLMHVLLLVHHHVNHQG